MEIIRFAFYKRQGDLWGWLIATWTGLFNPGTPAYSHVEIGFFIDGKWRYFSSASKNTNSATGTRWLDEEVVLEHPERWDIFEVLPLRTQTEMIETCNAELDKRYDWAGIYGFVTLFGLINSKNKWYCSEVCYYIFFGIWKKRVSPRRLYAKLKRHIQDAN